MLKLTQPFLRFRWDRQTHTKKMAIVTLAAHAHRGLIIMFMSDVATSILIM